MAEDWWSRWFKRRSPFRWFFGDIEDFMRDMEDFIREEFEDLSKWVPKDLMREKTLPDGTKVTEWGPFVYGYRITIGPDGKPQVEEFGNVKPETGLGRPRIGFQEYREPLTDVIETNGDVKVIVELPGVEKNDIKLYGTEETLTVSVDTPQRKYYKEIKLPCKVDTQQSKSSYKNGILEVTLRKKEEKPKGEPLKID